MYSAGWKEMIIVWLEYLLLERPVFERANMFRLTELEEIATKDEAVSFEEPGWSSLGYFLTCYNYL